MTACKLLCGLTLYGLIQLIENWFHSALNSILKYKMQNITQQNKCWYYPICYGPNHIPAEVNGKFVIWIFPDAKLA